MWIAVIGLSLLGLAILPFVLAFIHNTKKRKRWLIELERLSNAKSKDFERKEWGMDFLLALDIKRKVLVYLKEDKNALSGEVIDLKEIQSCQVRRVERRFENEIGKLIFYDHIDLALKHNNNANGIILLDIYDEEFNRSLTGQLQVAENWSQQLNDLLRD